MNIESDNVIVAIGVLSVMADEAYNSGADEQSPKWQELRGAIYYLTQKIESIAKEEVQR
jgi:predicted restriction endonuclease